MDTVISASGTNIDIDRHGGQFETRNESSDAPSGASNRFVKRRFVEWGFVLALPPVLFILYRAVPIIQNGQIDAYVYTGYLNNFEDLFARFGLTYYSVRFGFILPGMALSKVLGPVAGYFAFVYLLYLIAGVPLYCAFRKHFSTDRAAIALSVFVSSVWLARAQLWQYVDGATVSYVVAALSLILLDPQRKRFLAYILVGVLFSLAVNANFFAGALVALAVLPYLVVNFGRLRDTVSRDLIASSTGFLGVFAAGTLFYWTTIGEWNLLGPTIQMVTWGMRGGGNAYRATSWEWILGAPWVFVPVFVLLGFLATFRPKLIRNRLPTALLAYLLGSLAFFAWWQTVGVVLELFFYFSMLIPAVLLAATAVPVMASTIARLPWASNWAIVGIVNATPVVWQFAQGAAGHAALTPVLILAGLALVAVFISTRIVRGAVAACALFALASHLLFVVVPNGRRTLETGPFFDLVYGGSTRNELDVYRIAIKLIAALPKSRDDDRKLWFWYGSESEMRSWFLRRNEPVLDSLHSTYLWAYSRLHEFETGRSMPNLSSQEVGRLSGGEQSNLVLLGVKTEDLDLGTAALIREGITFRRRPDQELCSGNHCVIMRLLEIAPKRAALREHPYGGRWA
ncbi:MAG: hypothetical protein ACKVQT_01950, partial [Burkholderiales bacterium]